jgi:gluconate 2-dehydrogenase
MKPKVLVTRNIPAEVEQYIKEHCDVEVWRSEEAIPPYTLYDKIVDVSALLTNGTKVDDVLLARAPKLKIVSNMSVGYNNLDVTALRRRGVLATITPGVLDETVADLMMALMLAAARRIPELDKKVREGRWRAGDQTPWFGIDVHHKKLGIIGMGRIGDAIARRAKFGFGMDILYYNRSRRPEAELMFYAEYCELNQLLAESDYVMLMTPLTAQTERMMGAAQFAKMKPTAIFINGSRGQTVDEIALCEALKRGTIRAAGLDVFVEEPVPANHPLLSLSNVVAVPHIGSATAQTRFDMAMSAARNMISGLNGETPQDLIPEMR